MSLLTLLIMHPDKNNRVVVDAESQAFQRNLKRPSRFSRMLSMQRPTTQRTTNTRTSMVSCHKAFASAIVDMSSQIHVDFLRLLWVLADKQMRSY